MHPESAVEPTPVDAAPPAEGAGLDAVRVLLGGPGSAWPALLVVASARARAEGWGPEGAIAVAAEAAAGGRPVVLADLDYAAPSLHDLLGLPNWEGAADVVLFGASVRRAAVPVEELGFAFLPAGDALDPEEVVTHPHWAVVAAEMGRIGGLLLLYAPDDGAGVAELAAGVGHALALADPLEGEAIRAAFGPRCELAAVIAPAEADVAPAEAVAAPVLEAAPEPVVEAEPVAAEPAFAAEAAPVLEPEPALSAEPALANEAELDTAADAEPAFAQAESDIAAGESAFAVEAELDSAAHIEPAFAAEAESEVETAPAFAAEAESEADAYAPAFAADAEPALANKAELDAATETEPALAFQAELDTAADAQPALAQDSASPELDIAPIDLAEAEPAVAGRARRGRTRIRGKHATAATAAEPPIPPVAAKAATRYSVPKLPEWQEWIVRVVAVVMLAYGVYYIAWRWTSTLNPEALWFSIPLALAETWGLLTAFIMVHSVWRLKHRTPVPPAPGLSVDVFITCFDEPLEVIRRTAVGARAIRYPHRTYLLDDGKRDEVRAMAAQLGIEYLRREGTEHAKAGNLNHALAHTRGDFVLQLDADHVPLPHILERLLGFFEDPKLGFVQAPQDFYNTDGFTYDVSEWYQRIWEEQRLFFSVIQPGKDSINGAFFCGSCAVFRREALESVGGFGTHSITEDIETSLLLHAAGWRSAYYGESLAYGMAAGSATAFHIQHLRWGQGAMQVIRRFNPLTHPGLSLSQRVSYFGSLTAYVGGVQKLVFYCAPLVFFLTGALPIRAIDRDFLVRFLPFLALSFILSELVARGTANTWMSERFQMAKFWTYTRAVMSYFWRRPLKFAVTPKGPGHVPFRTYAPQVVLMVMTLVAIFWATAAHRNGWVDYGVPGWTSPAFRVNLLWASLNFILAASVVGLSLRVRQQRGDHRFRDQFPISVRTRAAGGGKLRATMALTEDLNPMGMAFRMAERLPVGAEVHIRLPLTTGMVRVRGRVVHTVAVADGGPSMFRTGVAFDGVPLRVRDAIELHCIQHAVPLERAQYSGTRDLLTRTREWTRNVRRERREQVRLPARVWVRRAPGAPEEAGRHMAYLAEISASGARLVMDEPVEPGSLVRFAVPGTRIRGVGRAVFSHATETPIGVRFAIGVRRSGAEPPRQKPVSEKKMAIPYVLKRAVSLLCVPAALAVASAPAAAQLQAVVYGGAEVDTEDLALFLLGASVHTTGLGPGLGVGVLGYHLTFPVNENTTEAVNGIQPQVELRYAFPTHSVQANVGYLFIEGKDVTPVGAPSGAEEGLVTALQANYWGSEGGRSGDAIASYNWRASYFWGRLRGLQQISGLGERGGVSLGAELVAQGTADDDTYRAFQAGPVVEVAFSPSFRLQGVVGAKTDNRVDAPSVFPYFKLEFVAIPGL
jgi:cellulose synthase (UDP-forming)